LKSSQFKIQICGKVSDEETTKIKVVDQLHNIIVDNFYIYIIYPEEILFEFITFLNFKILNNLG
jgi:hypothetical protein